MKNILVLGDSFSYGEGCSDRPNHEAAHNKIPSDYSWVSLLRNDLYDISPLGYNVINLSRSGNSLMGMYKDLLQYTAFHSDTIDMIIFSVTSFNRMLVSHPTELDNTANWVVNGEEYYSEDSIAEYNKSKKMFMKYLFSETVFDLHGIAYMNAIHHYATVNNIKCLSSVPRIPELYKKSKTTPYLDDFNFTHLFNYDFSGEFNDSFNKTCIVSDGHPNDLGHSIYYAKIVKPKVLQYIKDNL